MDSKRSSARITWATLSWSTGLRLLSAMAGGSSTCLLRGIATRTLILRTQVSSTRPMSLSLPMADPKRRTSSSRSHSTNVIAIEAFVRRLYIREAYKLNLRAISMPAGCKRSSNRSISNSQRRENRLSSLRPSRRELQPRCGLLWSLRPTRSAADSGSSAMSYERGSRYCETCHVGQIVQDHVTITAISEGVRGYALDAENAEALWKK